MTDFVCKYLLGMQDSREILSMDLVFEYAIPFWLVAFVLILIGVYCHQIYAREAAEMSKPWRLTLTVLRFLVWFFVIMLLLQPRIIVDRLVTPKSNLAVLIDTSKSMTLVERQAQGDYFSKVSVATGKSDNEVRQLTRAQIASAIINNPDLALIDQLKDKYALRFFAFDKGVKEFSPLSDDGEENPEKKKTGIEFPPIEGDVTQLGQALREVANRLRGLPVAGVLALTDGGNNKGEDPEVVANLLADRDIPVFPIGIGVPEAVDIKVVDVAIPDLVFVGDELAVKVTLQASSLEGSAMPLQLKLGGVRVGGGEFIAKDGVFQKDFVIQPPKAGEFIFSAKVPVQPEEYATENNEIQKRVRVIDNAIRVLFVVETPSWEFRYLKGMLESDRRVEAKVFIRRGDLRRAQNDEEYLDTFPFDTLKRDFDCIIFNNIRADYFSKDQMEEIKKYISDEGGSMIMISSTSGTPGTFVGTPIGDLLPVEVKQIPEDEKLDLNATFTRGYKLRLTREGRYHTITRLDPLPDENAKLWPTLPDQFWYYNGIEKLKPLAVSLVEHSRASNQHGPIPLMAIQRYGRGQVLFLGLNSIWRWRYKIGNKLTNRFWGQTIQFMGLPHLLGNLKRVTFDTQGRNFISGERIDITARVVTQEYVPIRDPQITISATEQNSSDRKEFKFDAEAEKEGVFTGGIFLPEGTWDIQVVGYENEETLTMDVTPPRYEFENPAMQKSSLVAVAKTTGGEFIELDQIKSLLDKVQSSVKPTRSREEKSIWDTLFSLIAVLLLVTTEWVIRKRKDLV